MQPQNLDALSPRDRCEELTDLIRIDFADRWSSNARTLRRLVTAPSRLCLFVLWRPWPHLDRGSSSSQPGHQSASRICKLHRARSSDTACDDKRQLTTDTTKKRNDSRNHSHDIQDLPKGRNAHMTNAVAHMATRKKHSHSLSHTQSSHAEGRTQPEPHSVDHDIFASSSIAKTSDG